MAKASKQANGSGGPSGGPSTDADAAVAFLELFQPNGPWCLTAIVPDGRTRTETFTNVDAVKQFVFAYNTHCNIYFSVNPLKHAVKQKAKKTDIAAAAFVHTDLDPLATETPEAAKERYKAELEKLGLKVTFLIDSGNGLQAFFALDPLVTDFAAVEARALALTLKLGGTPGTQNVDRVMRLPGTVNWPGKVKLKAGRVPCLARLIEHNDVSYSLETFPEPAKKQQKQQKQQKQKQKQQKTEGGSVPNNAEMLLHATTVGNYASRSELLFAFIMMALRAGVEDDDIIEACLNETYRGCEIFEHVADQKDGRVYLERQIQRARDKVGDDEKSELTKMNEKHAVLPIGGKTRVATWGRDAIFPDYTTIVSFSPITDFRQLKDKYRIEVVIDGAVVSIGRGTWWLSQRGRRQFDGGMKFMPQRNEKVVDDTLNLWHGFAVEARKPSGKSGAAGCSLFLDHGLKIICSGNVAHFDYLIKREALIAQQRIRSEIAVGLKSEQEGTGKGFWERWLNRLYGRHAMQVTKSEHVLGKHNRHLESLLRLTADEALFAGDPKQRNALFGLITEPTLTVEPKFVDAFDAPNHLNLSLISNHDHYIPAGAYARRFCALEVSAARANDHAYFAKITDQLVNEGGLEALLFYLLHEVDLRGFNVRNVPKTAQLAEQAAYSRTGVDLLVETVCSEAAVPCCVLQGVYDFSAIYPSALQNNAHNNFDVFIDRHQDAALRRLGSLRVKRRLKQEWGCKTGKAARYTYGITRISGVAWPPLQELRARFVAKHGPQEWLSPDAKEWLFYALPDFNKTTASAYATAEDEEET